MIPFVCLYADTLSVHHFQDFDERAPLPVDLPHKNLIWRKVVEVHPEHDIKTEREEGTSFEVTETECIITHLIVPREPEVPETDEQRDSRTLRAVQSACFSPERIILTMVVFDLYNEVRVLKGQDPLSLVDFKKVLQSYAT